jgi:predicted esterase
MKWILPQAPLIPSSYNNGKPHIFHPTSRTIHLTSPCLTWLTSLGALFPAWFDTRTLDFLDPPNDDVPNQDRAVQYLLSLIQAELENGLLAKKIYIGGYSQGATIALRTALVGISRLRGNALGGVVVLKGWVARGETIAQVCLSLSLLHHRLPVPSPLIVIRKTRNRQCRVSRYQYL